MATKTFEFTGRLIEMGDVWPDSPGITVKIEPESMLSKVRMVKLPVPREHVKTLGPFFMGTVKIVVEVDDGK